MWGDFWGSWGAGSAQDAPQTNPSIFLGDNWANIVPQGSILGPTENRKSLQNRTFEQRSAPGPSKNALREGFWKKHEK